MTFQNVIFMLIILAVFLHVVAYVLMIVSWFYERKWKRESSERNAQAKIDDVYYEELARFQKAMK